MIGLAFVFGLVCLGSLVYAYRALRQPYRGARVMGAILVLIGLGSAALTVSVAITASSLA